MAMMGERERQDRKRAETDGPVLRYEPNPKHKEPWQRGVRGCVPATILRAWLADKRVSRRDVRNFW